MTFASMSFSMVSAHPEGALVADSAPFCPYVGLRPFREEDRPYFFGRENEIRTIADNLYGARLTILYGASGVGKSSVLMAGLVPQLRKEPRTAVVMFRRWQVPQASALLKQQVIESASAVGGKSLAIDENLPLDELLKQAADTLDGTILLLLDQFEEYFLYFPDPGPEGGFDAELARAINRRNVDAGFLISMREDSLSKLDRLRKRITTLFGNTQQLSHLWLGAAKLAVLKPLEVYNAQHPDAAGKPVTIEPALVQALLKQVSAGQVSIAQTGGAGQAAPQAEETRVEAPYLQLVLERLWGEEMRSGSRELRLTTLEALGGCGQHRAHSPRPGHGTARSARPRVVRARVRPARHPFGCQGRVPPRRSYKLGEGPRRRGAARDQNSRGQSPARKNSGSSGPPGRRRPVPDLPRRARAGHPGLAQPLPAAQGKGGGRGGCRAEGTRGGGGTAQGRGGRGARARGQATREARRGGAPARGAGAAA